MSAKSLIFCNNCGVSGHTFKDCRDPILSCGIILLRNRRTHGPSPLPIQLNDLELLMVRRKDSMSYTEFMRGRYETTNIAYVKKLIENMTITELSRLRKDTFESLWDKLWASPEKHEHEFKLSKSKYDSVREHLFTTNTIYNEPEWGFPKGRRLKCETDGQCAEREFYEETNIPRSSYIIVSGVILEETFRGTNDVPYSHRYFVALLKNPNEIDIHQKFTLMQRREISAIGWKSLSDCDSLTRPHYIGRKPMLLQLAKISEAFEVNMPRE
ncbi:NUDIX domain-containing protein [bacterium]|nr:NUDIX domain-containing protein [Actinomycetota bacterium]NDG32557.1 NUDIX domain-containing protein [bacterium]